MHNRIISVIGLGYVGLPVAVSFASNGDRVIAFDIDETRIRELREGHDRTGEVERGKLEAAKLHLTSDRQELRQADFHIVTVPTPITENRQPDLRPLIAASTTLGGQLKKGDIVVYESTVYPGATEEDCVPILERESGLTFGSDFTVGYSPERINPGDAEHRFETIVKVVSGSDAATLDTVADVYGTVVTAGIHRAPSIKVAEAAKVIENTQRDLNIALVNELALIFDRMDIRTKDVLAAAKTKWNFLPFEPGLVGGHCIGVDPYYLTAKAETQGYHSEVILSGRRINDGIGEFIANKVVKLLARRGVVSSPPKIAILGVTFKENVPDLRNSRVPDIDKALREYGLAPLVHDPLADPGEARATYGIELAADAEIGDLDALVLAVPHAEYLANGDSGLLTRLKPDAIIVDVKSAIDPAAVPAPLTYWSL